MKRKVLQEIQALHELADTVWKAKSLAEVLQIATDRVADLLGADRVSLITFDLPQKTVIDFVKGGPGSSQILTTVQFDELLGGLSGWVLKTGQSALSPKGKPDPRESAEASQRRAQTECGSILVVPLKHRDQLLGTMTAIRKPSQRNFVKSDSDLMTLFAGYCAMVTDNSRILIDLRKAKEEAEASNRAKSEFLAIMSHELRTPLNAILGFSHLLGMSPLDEHQQDYTKAISTGGENLLGIINNILDLAKMEAGNLTLELQPFRISACIDAAWSEVGKTLNEKGLESHFQVAPEIQGYFLGDEVRLRQILVNLLGNAAKFTTQGSIELIVTGDGSSGLNPRIRFQVRDTGIGIPREKFDKLFKAFSQVDGSTTREHGGTGLGLAIARHLVHMMGGEIQVESTLGQGSCFSFQLVLPRTSMS